MISYFKNSYNYVHILSLLIICVFYQLAGKAFAFFLQDSYKFIEIILLILSGLFFRFIITFLYIVFF